MPGRMLSPHAMVSSSRVGSRPGAGAGRGGRRRRGRRRGESPDRGQPGPAAVPARRSHRAGEGSAPPARACRGRRWAPRADWSAAAVTGGGVRRAGSGRRVRAAGWSGPRGWEQRLPRLVLRPAAPIARCGPAGADRLSSASTADRRTSATSRVMRGSAASRMSIRAWPSTSMARTSGRVPSRRACASTAATASSAQQHQWPGLGGQEPVAQVLQQVGPEPAGVATGRNGFGHLEQHPTRVAVGHGLDDVGEDGGLVVDRRRPPPPGRGPTGRREPIRGPAARPGRWPRGERRGRPGR